MNSSHYYDDLAINTNYAQKVGWRRRVGQAYRFDFVRQIVESLPPNINLLDVGCGTCALPLFLNNYVSCRAGNWNNLSQSFSIQYFGVDPYPHPLESDLYQSSFRQVALEDLQLPSPTPFTLAVAIGTLVNNNQLHPRKQHFLNFVHHLNDKATHWLLVAVDLEKYNEINTLPDPLIEGLRLEWLAELSPTPYLHQISREEVAITNFDAHLSNDRAFWSAIRSKFSNHTPSEAAWLAYQIGAFQRSETFLRCASRPLDPLGQVVAARLTNL